MATAPADTRQCQRFTASGARCSNWTRSQNGWCGHCRGDQAPPAAVPDHLLEVTLTPTAPPADPLHQPANGTASPAGHVADPADIGGLTAMEFIDVAESVTAAAQQQGLHTVGFSSSPGGGHDRTIRRAGHDVLVAVNRLGRPAGAVVSDLVDGIIAANDGNGNRDELMAAAHNTLTDRRRAARQNPKN